MQDMQKSQLSFSYYVTYFRKAQLHLMGGFPLIETNVFQTFECFFLYGYTFLENLITGKF